MGFDLLISGRAIALNGGVNNYLFVHNNPITKRDLVGLDDGSKCKKCDGDNPAKELFKNAADNLVSLASKWLVS
jgi:hypothetical protein